MNIVSIKKGAVVNTGIPDEYFLSEDTPAWREEDNPFGKTIICWNLTFKERLKLIFTGKVWHSILTFNKPIQTQYMSVDNPFINEE